MRSLSRAWLSLVSPISEDEEDSRREYMTRVIFAMVSGGLLSMSIIIPVFDFSVGEPEYTASLVMLFIDSLMVIGWILIYQGRWTISRYMLPIIFLGLGSYFIFTVGPITTGILQYAIAIILTALLFGNKVQWVTVGFSLVFYLAFGWLSGERDFEIFFTGGVVIGASLSGIALLQWFSYTLLETSLKRARQAETDSREIAGKIRAIFESIDDGLTITNLEGNIIDLNEATVKLHAFEHKDELLGHNALELIAQQDHPKAMENLMRTLKEGHSGLLEYTFITKNGQEFNGELNAVLIADETSVPTGFVALTRNITSRKRAESERETLIKKLEEKNTELENFTYTVSHDLKAPLITISGFLGYLEEDALKGNTEQLKRDIQRISDATGKMQRLLNELLELSRIGRMTNPPEETSFEELARDALENVQGRLKQCDIAIRLQPGLPTVYGDRQRLIEVLQNLIDNAAKFIGEQPEPQIEIGQRGEDGGMPVFFVRDNGIGIASEHHERVFGLFERLNPRSEGTGIGLAIVRKIIEYHGGRIWIESQGIGLGTTFCFTLPIPNPRGKNDSEL